MKWLYLYWITLSATTAVLPRSPLRSTPRGSSVTTGGNRSTRRKPAMFGRDKLDNILLTCDQGNFNQITECCRNRTPITLVKDTCTTTVPPAPLSPLVPPTIYSSISPSVPPSCLSPPRPFQPPSTHPLLDPCLH